MKTFLLIIAFAFAAVGPEPALQYGSAQELRHDKFSNQSWYQSKFVNVYRAKSGLLVFNPGRVSMMTMSSATASLGGEDRVYSVLFEVQSSDWQFAGGECVIWTLADGVRKQFGCSVISSNARSQYRGGVTVTEGLTMRTSAVEFKTLFTAKEIELRVGFYEFKLKENHLKELRKVIL